MAMGTRETDQPPLWIATSDLPTSPGHPFYARLTTLLDGHHFDRFVEGLCDRFYAPVMGRPSLAPGRYFRLLLVGYFEGIDSERGMAWRATDSLAVRSFLRLAVDEAPPDHSTIARTRRLIDLETHRAVFTWVQQRLVEAGRLTGKTIALDATTLEANAAMRSIVRRDTGESYQAFLAGLATASGIETPTREGLARLDRKRKKKTSNTDWTNPHDPDAKVTKMKDGRTHLAHKAEHAVDMETGAIVAVTLQGADVGDTTTIIETAIAAAEQVEDAQANVDDRQSLEEIVGDKGYHSNQTLIDLDAGGIRSYVSEPDRGRRDWSKDPEARAPVYGNRRRMRGRRGRRLMRQRGERIERSFAHLYDTGGMRRTHLRGHTNILKRLLIHAGGFNLGLVMRHLIGIGTPRGLQGRVAAVLATLGVLMGVVRRRLTTISSSHRLIPAVRGRLASLATFAVNSSAAIHLHHGLLRCQMSISPDEVQAKGEPMALASRMIGGCALSVLGMVFALPGMAYAKADETPTYTKDVAPIFREKCEACHRPGYIAPMSLQTYAESRPWARSIQNRVATRQMPPWHIDKSVGIQDFQNDRVAHGYADRHHRSMGRRWRPPGRPGRPSAGGRLCRRRRLELRGTVWRTAGPDHQIAAAHHAGLGPGPLVETGCANRPDRRPLGPRYRDPAIDVGRPSHHASRAGQAATGGR